MCFTYYHLLPIFTVGTCSGLPRGSQIIVTINVLDFSWDCVKDGCLPDWSVPHQELLSWSVLVLLICLQILVHLDCFSHSIKMEVRKPARWKTVKIHQNEHTPGYTIHGDCNGLCLSISLFIEGEWLWSKVYSFQLGWVKSSQVMYAKYAK